MRKIRGTTIVTRVRKLGDTFPDALYVRPEILDSCSYSRGSVVDGPKTEGCIIGQALRGLVSIPTDLDTYSVVGLLDAQEGELASRFEIEDSGIIDWLASVQNAQDDGLTWGKAVAIADKIEGEIGR